MKILKTTSQMRQFVYERLVLYWTLIKSLQTGLLIVTGFTGYFSVRAAGFSLPEIIGLFGSLLLAISGSTVLNMIFDRDIDALMQRTAHRPLPAGKISFEEAAILGFVLSVSGLIWAFLLAWQYGAVVWAGLFIDVVIYTVWLKRKTAWSILWGGISGGMPILAGRVLAVGQIDLIGVLLALSILLWIPTHIMTFNIRHYSDYLRADIPTFPSTYGYQSTRLIIALSCLGASIAISVGAYAVGISWGYLRLLSVLTVGMLGIAVVSIVNPSEKVNLGLFKYASLYMFGIMAMMIWGML